MRKLNINNVSYKYIKNSLTYKLMILFTRTVIFKIYMYIILLEIYIYNLYIYYIFRIYFGMVENTH